MFNSMCRLMVQEAALRWRGIYLGMAESAKSSRDHSDRGDSK